MEKFFCIKLINKNGERGYILDSPEGIMIAKNGVVSNIKQFETYSHAQKWLRENKVENNRCKAYIRDNFDLMKDENGSGISVLEKEAYYLENEKGEKLCYDAEQEGYYFKKCEIMYCFFESEKELQEFCEQFEFDVKVIIKKHSPTKIN